MKKKKFLIIAIICILIIIATVIIIFNINKKNRDYTVIYEQEYNYFLLNIDGYYGVISRDGEELINPVYDRIDIPNRDYGVFITYKDDEIKVLNENGEEIFSDLYVTAIDIDDDVDSFDTTRIKYEEDSKYGLMDFSGNKITDAIYEEISSLPGKYGEYRAKKDGKYGVLSNTGVELVEFKYDYIEGDGYMDSDLSAKDAGYIVGTNDGSGMKYGYIDKNEKVILKIENENITRVSNTRNNEFYLIVTQNGRSAIYQSKKKQTDYIYIEIEYALDDTNTADKDLFLVKKNKKYGVLDGNFNTVLETKYSEIYVSGIYINATLDEENFIFDLSGNEQTDLSYIGIEQTATEKYYIAETEDNEYTVLNLDKEEVLDKRYDYIKEVEGTDLIAAYKDENITIYSANLQELLVAQNATLDVVNDYIKVVSQDETNYFTLEGKKVDNTTVYLKNKIYSKQDAGKWGFVDIEGNVVVDYKYDKVTEINEYGFAGVKKDGKWGVIDEEGNVVLKPYYESDAEEPIFIGKYCLNGTICSEDLY